MQATYWTHDGLLLHTTVRTRAAAHFWWSTMALAHPGGRRGQIHPKRLSRHTPPFAPGTPEAVYHRATLRAAQDRPRDLSLRFAEIDG